MRVSSRLSAQIISIAFLLTALAGCGGGGKPAPPAISVSLSPATQSTIDQAQNVNFTATVANDSSNRGVTWSVSGTGCTGDACGTLSNTTTTAATYNAPATVAADLTVSVRATSAADTSKSASSTVVVKPPPSITTTTLSSGIVGVAYSATLAASGGAGTLTWSVASGSLPAGLSLSSSGAISGTPTAAGTSTFTVKVTDSAPTPLSDQKQLSITINSPLTITTTSLPDGVVGAAYSQTLAASAGTTPYTWSLASGTLPAGLGLDSSTGTISGTPTTAATSTFTVKVTDATTPTAQTATAQLSITITASSTACGSGNEAVMNGEYAFELTGYDATGFRAYILDLTANGAGSFSAGWLFQATTDTAFSSTPVFGTYSVGSDNRGCAAFTMGPIGLKLRFALGSLSSGVASKGRVIQFETPATTAYIAAGEIWKRDPTTFSTGLDGSYAFAAAGIDVNLARLGFEGVLTFSSSNVSTGEADMNDNGTMSHATGVTGHYAGGAPGLGEYEYTLNNVPWGTILYVYTLKISDSEAVFWTARPTGPPAVVGVIRKQTGTFANSSLNGVDIEYLTGTSYSGASGSEAIVGASAFNGAGSASDYRYEDDSGVSSYNFGGFSYSVAPNGRALLNGGNYGVIYLTAPNTGFILLAWQSVHIGEIEPQVGAPFDQTSLSGAFALGTDCVLSQDATTDVGSLTLDGAGNVTGVVDSTSTTSQAPNASLAGTQYHLSFTVSGDYPEFYITQGTSSLVRGGLVISANKVVAVAHPTSTQPTVVIIEKSSAP
jgi:hypothetical protein